jgi:uncharacterized protein (DUF1800 family)
MSARDAVTALRRFGLGAKPGDLKRIAADPRGYVLAGLSRANAARLDSAGLQPSHVVFAEVRTAARQQQQARREKAMAETAASSVPKDMSDAAPSKLGAPVPGRQPAAPGVIKPEVTKSGAIRREAYREEAAARLARGRTTDDAFIERLTLFWSNHFCVSATKGPVRALAGAFEREAIRPHVLGRFRDMLQAVEHHPAMLVYLDNAQSVGPTSRAGINNKKGLNENLAREILELHTLGVHGGYTQADVTNAARVITGWTVGGLDQQMVEPGRFLFTPNRHEPGIFRVLAKSYGDGGEAAGEAMLDDFARHPATARHIASKLARHFVSDNPPPALISRLEKVFRDSDGDLAEVSRALATAPEAWDTLPKKVAPPYDFLVSLARGFRLDPPAPEINRLAGLLGQPLWSPPSPAGWPDDDDAWMGPSPVRERLRIAELVAGQTDRAADPRAAAEELLGPALSEATRQSIARAETREQGFAILIMSPESLRR